MSSLGNKWCELTVKKKEKCNLKDTNCFEMHLALCDTMKCCNIYTIVKKKL